MPIQLHLSEENKLKVLKDLRDGSDPRRVFFMMVVLSTMIAAFGLVMNSVAVVIGAMLVAPLMTPILGLGLGLVRGDAQLIGIALRAELGEGIREVLQSELANFPISDLSKITHTEDDSKLLVLAEVDAPRVLSPQQVSRIQTRVEDKVSRPVHLNIRTTVTKDVSAAGHHDIDFTETLDGFAVSPNKERRRDADDIAEQIVREYLGDKLGVYMEDLREYPFGHRTLFVADVAGSRWLGREEISEIEGLLRDRFGSTPIEFRVVQRKSFQRNHKGELRTQFEIRRPLSPEEQAVADRIEALALDWFSENGFRLIGWSLTVLKSEFHVLFEVVGTRLFLPPDQQVLHEKLADNVDVPVSLFVRSVLETLVGQEGQMNFDHLLQEYRRRNRAAYGDETRRLIDEMH